MFNQKNCKRCGEKINSKHRFCSNCGLPMQKNNNNDWGMLGKKDIETRESPQNPFLSGFTGGIFNKMLGSAMKMLEKEMQKEISKANTQPRTSVRLMINGKEININDMNKPKEKIKRIEKSLDEFSKSNLKKFSELVKKEPKTNIKRLSDKVIYEINLPGVKSIKDISIVKLENSIEIKAIAKNKAYFKLIPINLPIIDYDFSKGTLILELEAKN